MATLYDRIKSRRTELGLTVEELAHKMGYKDKSSISKIENGKADIPQSKIAAFADALQTTPAYLMGWEEQPDPKKPTIPPGFEPMPKMKKIPLIGSIACGEPITAEQNIEKMVDVPENIRCDFSLTCHGDSMVDAGIHDKDVVYIRIQPEVENGEIAAVRIDGEATLKRVYYNPGTLTLMPANPAYAPMIYTGPQLEEVHIEGKAVGWTHWVG
ncbi:LexA family transcriptional regulator [Faecalibacterium taiwanense]|uniref:LexA family protein n=1 Tax=Faecalibacterium taiwanense TaxID=3030638 RepID=UPI0031FE8B27